MSAHRAPRARRHGLRRSATAVVVALSSGIGFLAAAGPSAAAGPWFVGGAGASNANTCLSAAAPCATVTAVLAKPGFVSGDTINVAPGVYTDHPVIAAKGANIVGTGSGVFFDGSGTTWALGVNGSPAPTVNLSNLTLRNGGFSGGGAFPVVNGTVTTTNVNVINSKASSGAGVMVYGTARLTMNGGSITGNTATATAALGGAGGAVYVVGKQGATAAGVLVLDGVTVSGNTANGAAQVAGGNGGAIFNAGTTTVRNSTFSGNQAVATSNTSNTRRGQGGAIMNGGQDADDAPVLTISDSTISGGTVAGGLNSSTGGAIANGESFGGPTSTTTATNVTLAGNAAVLGGAIYNGASLKFNGGAISSSTAFSGGAVYNSPLIVPAQSAATVATFDGTSFTNNSANGQTAANYGNGGAIFNTATTTVKNATFTGNKAVAASAASTATGWGGAIWNGAFATTNVPKLTITDTKVNGGGVSGGNAVVGGAIADVGNVFGLTSAPATLDATNLVVDANSALAGGGLYVGGPATLTGGSVTSNKATSASAGFGGGLYITRSAGDPSPAVVLDSVDVTGNSAAVVGGGLAQGFGTSTKIRNGSLVDSNSSAISGGGVYNAGDLTVSDSRVSSNSAAFQGGGIYNGSSVATDAPKLALANSAIDDNTAASGGGGVVTIKGATLTATGGHLDGNSAVGGGGVVVGDGGSATFDGTDFVDNTASASGGAAILNSGTTSVVRSSLSGNHALHTTGNTGLGAAIYSGSNSDGASTSLTVGSSTIAGNDAWAGSALVTFSPGDGATNKASIDNTTITGNTSSSTVGAIEQFHPLTITNSTVTDNTAAAGSGSAGALSMVVPASVGVAGSIFSGNTPAACSGAVSDGGYNLAAPADTGCGFTAARHDLSAAPQLGALADNGGPTKTRLPGPASPALGAVPAATATTLSDAVSGNAVQLCGPGAKDQRGTDRPQGSRCDVGSVEVVQVTPTVGGPSDADYTVGNPGAPVTFTSTGTPQATLSEAGALPSGVTFHDNGDGTATLSGTPAAGTGGAYAITVKATNEAGTGTKDFTLRVHQAPLLSGPSASTYTVGQAGGPDVFHQTSGYPDATLSTSSDLPDGVEFTPGAGGTGTIAGTPAVGTGGVYPVTIDGTNGTPPDAHWPFTLTVDEAPAITGPASVAFTAGTSGSSDGYVGSGFPKPTFTATGLPAGLHVESTGPGTARISGVAADGTGGEYDATLIATNGVGTDATKDVHVVVNEAPELTGPSAVRFVAGRPGLTVFSADGYPGAHLTITGALPSGVTFHDNGNGTATLAGTAPSSEVGSYAVTVRASNGVDPDAVLHVTLEVAPQLTITSTSLAAASVGSPYGATVAATGGLPPYSFTLISGTLPAGLSLASNGQITGTPTGPTGTYSFTVRATDTDDPQEADTRELSITVDKGSTTLVADPVILKVGGMPLLGLRLAVVGATLTGGSPAQPIAGQTVVFKAGGTTVCTGVTGTDGKVTCVTSITDTLLVTLNLGVTATYAGSSLWLPSSGSAGLVGS